MSVINTYQYYLNSENRTSGTISDFYVNVPPLFAKTNTKFRMKILEATIPFTFNQLNSRFNTINYTITRTGYGTNSSILTIPEGNYTILTLLSNLKTLLQQSIQTLIGVNLTTLSFTYDTDTLHASLGFTGEATATTISWTNVDLNEMLGISSAVSFTNLAAQISDKPVNVNPSKSLFIRSSTIKSNSFENMNASLKSSTILLKIQITSGAGSYLRYQNQFDTFTYINDLSIDKIALTITDNSGRAIDLLLDWTCVVVIEEIIIPNTFSLKNPVKAEQSNSDVKTLIQEQIKRLEKEKKKQILAAEGSGGHKKGVAGEHPPPN